MKRRRLRIAQVAPLWFSLPPQGFAGTERIVNTLTEELVHRGHQVTLFASADTKTSAHLVPGWRKAITKEKLYGKPVKWGNCVFPLFNFSRVFEMADRFDIIHIHENNTCISNFFTHLVKTPSVITVHDPFPRKSDKDRWSVFRKYRDTNYVAISDSHRNGGKKIGIRFAGRIYNGIDVSKFPYKESSGDYLVWLGRSAPNKGAREAIRAAVKTKEKLILAGRIDKNSSVAVKYYENYIKPYLGKNIKYIGEVNDRQKGKLLSNAKATLYPVLWEEPFGLVMAESLACGTPVIGFKRGAVPEIVQHNKTGFVVKSVQEMARSIKKIGIIKRKDCRKRAEQKFSKERMVDAYEQLYYRIIKKPRKYHVHKTYPYY